MIWFDIKQLEKELAEGNLSDKEGYNYLLTTFILFTFPIYLTGEKFENQWFTFIQFVIDILFTIIFIRKTFEINTNGDNKDYLKRFLGLSFVTCIRLIVYILIAAIPAGIIIYIVEKSGPIEKNNKDLLMFLINFPFGIVFYYMLINSFRRVNQRIN